jgi:hypothetical protein
MKVHLKSCPLSTLRRRDKTEGLSFMGFFSVAFFGHIDIKLRSAGSRFEGSAG